MKKSLYIIAAILLLFISSCAWLDLHEGQEPWEHRVGRYTAIVILQNNPSYLSETEDLIQQGLSLVTGEVVDPAKVLDGMTDFINKFFDEKYEDFKKYKLIVSDALEYLKGLFELNLEIPAEKQEAAERIKQFLLGAQEGIDQIKAGTATVPEDDSGG